MSLGLFFDLGTFTYDLKYYLFEKNNWEYTFGTFRVWCRTAKTKARRCSSRLIPLRDEGGFAYLRHILGKMEWSAGIRFDQRHFRVKELVEDGETRFPALSRNFGQLSGSVGMSWFPSYQLVLKLNLVQGFRSPNIAELASNGVHEGTFRYELGNADLAAETNLELDGGMELDLVHVTLSLSPFSTGSTGIFLLRN
ncbi:MAG: TonB-dependent receptor [Lewinellaceae bacterium]|nr:TonB-dependent receptor [Lewinellaceae bacterium]